MHKLAHSLHIHPWAWGVIFVFCTLVIMVQGLLNLINNDDGSGTATGYVMDRGHVMHQAMASEAMASVENATSGGTGCGGDVVPEPELTPEPEAEVDLEQLEKGISSAVIPIVFGWAL